MPTEPEDHNGSNDSKLSLKPRPTMFCGNFHDFVRIQLLATHGGGFRFAQNRIGNPNLMPLNACFIEQEGQHFAGQAHEWTPLLHFTPTGRFPYNRDSCPRIALGWHNRLALKWTARTVWLRQ